MTKRDYKFLLAMLCACVGTGLPSHAVALPLFFQTSYDINVRGGGSGTEPCDIVKSDVSYSSNVSGDISCGTATGRALANGGLVVGAASLVETPGTTVYEAMAGANAIEGFVFGSSGMTGTGTLTLNFNVSGSLGSVQDSLFASSSARASMGIVQHTLDRDGFIAGSFNEFNTDVDGAASVPYVVNFRWGAPVIIHVHINTYAAAFTDGSAFALFDHTVTPADFQFRDSNGNLVTDVEVQSGSGVNPFATPRAVPEPATLVLLGLSLVALLLSRRKQV